MRFKTLISGALAIQFALVGLAFGWVYGRPELLEGEVGYGLR